MNCPFKGDEATGKGGDDAAAHISQKKCSTGYIFTNTDSCLTRAQTAGGSLQLSERFRKKAHVSLIYVTSSNGGKKEKVAEVASASGKN